MFTPGMGEGPAGPEVWFDRRAQGSWWRLRRHKFRATMVLQESPERGYRMGMAIRVDDLPAEAERMLRGAWEKQENLLLERDGEPLAVLVPIDQYRTQFPEQAAPTADAGADPYQLPSAALGKYQRLLAKRYGEGLSAVEQVELDEAGRVLDEADGASPLGLTAARRADAEHDRWMASMAEIIARLRTLRQRSGTQ